MSVLLLALAALWLLSGRLSVKARWIAWLQAWGILLLVGIAAGGALLGWRIELFVLTLYHGVLATVIMASLAGAGLICRTRYSGRRYLAAFILFFVLLSAPLFIFITILSIIVIRLVGMVDILF